MAALPLSSRSQREAGKPEGLFLHKATIPMIGLGLAALGRPGYINLNHDQDLPSKSVQDLQQNCWTVLDAAWEAGIRWEAFDTQMFCNQKAGSSNTC
jgi:aryl-alcohol dehydrogenase-like predicted oxidoreductase